VGARGERLLKELEAVGDLICRVDVEGCAVFFGEGGHAGSVTVENAIAVGEGAGIASDCFRQNSALCGEGVRGFRDDEPSDEIGYGAYAGEEGEKGGEDADEGEVPAIVEGEAGADSGDDPVVARAGELAGSGVCAGRGRGREGGSTGGAEAGGWVELLTALRAVHGRILRTILFCHKEIRVAGVVRSGGRTS